MKLFTNTIAATTLVLAITGTASAMVSPDLAQDVKFAAGANSNINVLIDGDTVTLTGYVEDFHALAKAEQAASGAGVDKVINNLIRSN